MKWSFVFWWSWGQPNNDINKLKYKDFLLEKYKNTVINTDSDKLI